MIKTLVYKSPYVMKTEIKEMPTGKKLRGGLFGRELVEYEEVVIPVPDYEKTNKQLVCALSRLIEEHCADIGEITHATIEPCLEGDAYLIRLCGSYGNFEKEVNADANYGRNGEVNNLGTPLSYLMEEFKMVFQGQIKKYQALAGMSAVSADISALIDIYLHRMREYEEGRGR